MELRLRGEIRIGKWRRFVGRETLDMHRGFVFRARVGWIWGSDSLVDGVGRMRWALFGLIPVAKASGPDTTRAAVGRWLIESIWLPTMLLPSEGARWEGDCVELKRGGETGRLTLEIESDGRLASMVMPRWGNPDGGAFGTHAFGGVVEREGTFDGFTIPTRVRAGWHFGSARWNEGEFFRVTIEAASFR